MDISARPTYRANLIRIWDSWVVEVPEAEYVHCVVLLHQDAVRTAREAIATVLDLDPDEFNVVIGD